jgi:hypothetical protein
MLRLTESLLVRESGSLSWLRSQLGSGALPALKDSPAKAG